MENNKGFKILAIVALCVAVAGLSVAYAALSETLEISGTAKVGATSTNWNVHFENGSCTKTGGATAGSITASGTQVTLGESLFTAPGDSVECTFDVVNDGTINAEVGTVTIPDAANLTYTGSGAAKTNDETLVKGNMEYTVTYADGSAIQVNDTLDKGVTKNLKLTLTYKATATSLPQADVSISDIVGTIIYNQA